MQVRQSCTGKVVWKQKTLFYEELGIIELLVILQLLIDCYNIGTENTSKLKYVEYLLVTREKLCCKKKKEGPTDKIVYNTWCEHYKNIP